MNETNEKAAFFQKVRRLIKNTLCSKKNNYQYFGLGFPVPFPKEHNRQSHPKDSRFLFLSRYHESW